MDDRDRNDELVRRAADEVDRSLLAWSLALTVRERLRAATRSTATLERLRRGASEGR